MEHVTLVTAGDTLECNKDVCMYVYPFGLLKCAIALLVQLYILCYSM
jgi:hypothetical protein